MFICLDIWEKCLLAAVVALMAAVLLVTISQESVTPDEVVHIAAGISYLQQHDERMNVEHPPLEKILAAVPLVIQGVKANYQDGAWAKADEVDFGWGSLRSWGLDGERGVFMARLPMVLLTLILAASVYLMARSLASPAGGVVSLLMFATSPFFFAYGPLVLTDIGIALFSLLSVWTFASLCQNPNLKTSAIFGLALSGALLSKFSSGLLLPTFVLLGVWFAFRPSGAFNIARAIRFAVVGIIVASLVVYAAYATIFWKTDTATFVSLRFEHSARRRGHYFGGGRSVAPAPLAGPDFLPSLSVRPGSDLNSSRIGPNNLFVGVRLSTGYTTVFSDLVPLQMTPGFICLVILLLCLWIGRVISNRAEARTGEAGWALHVRAIAMLFVVFAGAAVCSPLNIGIRHLSVPLAALTVLFGLIVPWSDLPTKPRLKLALLAITLVAVMGSVASAAVAFPHYLGYFNGLKGTRPVYQVAVGSDLDWGQTMIELRNYMHAHRIGTIKIDIRGTVPEIYLPEAQEFECEAGAPADAEWVAIGASRFITSTDLKIDLADRFLTATICSIIRIGSIRAAVCMSFT